ncbi:PIN domain-containing protein [Nonomuraea sp. NPDC003707]
MLKLIPGADYTNVRDVLTKILMGAQNVHAQQGPGVDFYNAYMAWVHESTRQFRNQVRPIEIDRLIATARYRMLLSVPFPASVPVRELLVIEIQDRIDELKQTLDDLRLQRERWIARGGFVVPDTTLFMQHPVDIESWDLVPYLNDPNEAPAIDLDNVDIHVVIPISVIDELDAQKNRGEAKPRGRARKTLAVLNRLFRDPTSIATLREPGFPATDPDDKVRRGKISLEILFDDPGHVRLPTMDDEIIDRAVQVQAFRGRSPIRFVTYDTGQSLDARKAGLETIRIEQPEEASYSGTKAKPNKRSMSRDDRQ